MQRGGKQEKEEKGQVGRQRRGRGGKEQKDMVIDGNDHECVCVFTCAQGGRFQVIWLLQGLKWEVLDSHMRNNVTLLTF